MYIYIYIYNYIDIDMNVGVQSFLLVKKPQNQGHVNVANPAKIKEAKFQQHNRKSLFERQDRKCKIPT